MTSAQAPARQLRDYLDRRVAVMLLLGFGSGLPFLLVSSTLSIWLREAGISLTAVGFFSYTGLAFTLKFLWAPFLDGWRVPLLEPMLGRRRSWMLVAQLGVAIGLVGMALCDPAASLVPLAAFATLTAFAAATQDIAVDAWRIEAAETEQQGLLAASYQLGYRLALILAGAGALVLAEQAGWQASYLAMAAAVAIAVAGTLAAPVADAAEPTRAGEHPGILAMIIAPIREIAERLGPSLVPVLALLALYRLPDFLAGVVANPLYIDAGYSKTEIAAVTKLYGVAISIAGAVLGGLSVARFGMRASLAMGALVAAASNLAFVWLALVPPAMPVLTIAISIDNLAGGFAGTALVAYMSSLTAKGHAAAQYALLTSLFALLGKVVGGFSGLAVDLAGYSTFFAATALLGIPAVLLSLYATRQEA